MTRLAEAFLDPRLLEALQVYTPASATTVLAHHVPIPEKPDCPLMKKRAVEEDFVSLEVVNQALYAWIRYFRI